MMRINPIPQASSPTTQQLSAKNRQGTIVFDQLIPIKEYLITYPIISEIECYKGSGEPKPVISITNSPITHLDDLLQAAEGAKDVFAYQKGVVLPMLRISDIGFSYTSDVKIPVDNSVGLLTAISLENYIPTIIGKEVFNLESGILRKLTSAVTGLTGNVINQTLEQWLKSFR